MSHPATAVATYGSRYITAQELQLLSPLPSLSLLRLRSRSPALFPSVPSTSIRRCCIDGTSPFPFVVAVLSGPCVSSCTHIVSKGSSFVLDTAACDPCLVLDFGRDLDFDFDFDFLFSFWEKEKGFQGRVSIIGCPSMSSGI